MNKGLKMIGNKDTIEIINNNNRIISTKIKKLKMYP